VECEETVDEREMVSVAEYIVLECLDCKHKDIYVNGTSDGKRCEQCNSEMYFPIDGGSKKELISRYNIKKR
jgi:ribosomal protein S27E